MLFNSIHYIFLFLPLTVLIYFFLTKISTGVGKIFLIFASLYFYSTYNFYYLILILISIFTNFYLANAVLNTSKKKYLILGITFNIFLLSFFKYVDFFILNINYFFSFDLNLMNFPFPLAISFFTLQQIGFLIDVYDKNLSKIKFKDYFLFVSFFPQLVAGPIVRVNFFINQFFEKEIFKFNFKNFNIGFFLIALGLFKKIVITDTLNNFVELGYANPSDLSTIESIICTYSFSLQIYFDFSAYVDIALGSALLFNIKLPINFNSPYRATSIINFWERWHITLTNFLTNFIYLPIARSFKKLNFVKSMLITLFVFFIAGIWHGPSWMYVIFGVLHGLGIVINHIFRKFFNFKLNKLLSWFLTFNYINVTFIFFRSPNLEVAFQMLKNIFIYPISVGMNFNSLNVLNLGFLNSCLLIFSFTIAIFFKNSNYYLDKFKPSIFNLLLTLCLLILSTLIINKANEFIYFNF